MNYKIKCGGKIEGLTLGIEVEYDPLSVSPGFAKNAPKIVASMAKQMVEVLSPGYFGPPVLTMNVPVGSVAPGALEDSKSTNEGSTPSALANCVNCGHLASGHYPYRLKGQCAIPPTLNGELVCQCPGYSDGTIKE